MSQKKKVIYYYDNEVGNFYYGQNHPMKPHRMRMTHSLIINYGLWKNMNVYRPYRLNSRDMTLFHSDDYVHFLKSVTPENENNFGTDTEKFNIDIDCPIFDGVFRFCQISSGGSVGGAYKINKNLADYSINWSGGLHHAKKSEASGFCYINDIVLSILELLKYHNRVLYVDIDIHHGDGVEEAFYHTNRVLCLSLHKYGNGFFPGTGHIKDIGYKHGKGYSINFPFNDGVIDLQYYNIFKTIIDSVIDKYKPECIVLQSGADSLAYDRIGVFNLTTKGHGNIVKYIRSLNIPLLVLGGGGYTIKNVARCWTYETSVLTNIDISDDIPCSEYPRYYKPNFKLHVNARKDLINKNIDSELQDNLTKVLQQIKDIDIGAPNVQMCNKVPDLIQTQNINRDEQNPDKRISEQERLANVDDKREFYDDEKDQDTNDNTKGTSMDT